MFEESCELDKDVIKGTLKQVKERIGKVASDASLEAEGKIDHAEGALQKAFGETKDVLNKDC